MLKYKIALLNVGSLYFRLAVFFAVGCIYCSVLFMRYIRNSYIETFQERPM